MCCCECVCGAAWLAGDLVYTRSTSKAMPMPATDAQSRQTAFGLALLHLMQQRGRNPHPGATDRMTQRDGAAVYVQSILIEL